MNLIINSNLEKIQLFDVDNNKVIAIFNDMVSYQVFVEQLIQNNAITSLYNPKTKQFIVNKEENNNYPKINNAFEAWAINI
jgi:hypothetical protein